jgi:predicted Fe-Mo cluster-binding NifX family protein
VKIAVATDDGKTISRHFGRARMYAVLTVRGGAVTSREIRTKSAPHWRDNDHAGATLPTGGHGESAHGTDPESAAKHTGMFAAIRDCECVIAGGMGRGAYDHAVEAGLRPFVTSVEDIDLVAVLCAGGRLADESERLH